MIKDIISIKKNAVDSAAELLSKNVNCQAFISKTFLKIVLSLRRAIDKSNHYSNKHVIIVRLISHFAW